MFESSKHLTTSSIASQFLIFDKNWLPSPSPCEAPLTSPAISVISQIAGTHRDHEINFAEAESYFVEIFNKVLNNEFISQDEQVYIDVFMEKIKTVFNLLRVKQYVKNLFIFAPLILYNLSPFLIPACIIFDVILSVKPSTYISCSDEGSL